MITVYSCITEVVDLGDKFFLIAFDAPDIAPLCRPGHFINIRIEENYTVLLRRPIAVFDVEGTIVKILVKAIGKGTCWLAQRRKGDVLDIVGPLGNGLYDAGDAKRILMVAGGVGLAPLYFYLSYFKLSTIETVLFYGARTDRQLFFKEELKELLDTCVFVTEDGGFGEKGLAPVVLEQHYSYSISDDDIIMACGPNPMLHRLVQFAEIKGIPCQVSLESYMGCGCGVCLSCVLPARNFKQNGQAYFRLCTDGPVVDSRKIDLRFFEME